MSKRESISRFSLIINKLRKGPASFADIDAYLAKESDLQEYNFRISKRTFDRDRLDIASLYNIEIEYNFSTRMYSITDEQKPEANERILEAFDTFNALNITDRLSNFIYFEKRKPQGTEHLYGVLHAIKNNKQIKYEYYKYWDETHSIKTVEPYALKEFKQRWYILAKDTKDGYIKTFALDRMSDLSICKQSFMPNTEFDLNDYFKNCFGIISSRGKDLEEVLLSFSPMQGKYIKSMPLHESQHIVIENENETRVSLQVYPTFDLVQELLSYGDNVKVLGPQSLIKEMKLNLSKALELYK